jgi:16S rRNA (uracil1498-N3)-methyltransferase
LTSNHFLVKQKNLRPPYASLDGEEHHHLCRVLRTRPGEKVWLVDERGTSFRAEVLEVGRDQTRLFVLEKEEASAAKVRVVLAQALIKSKNMDLVIQKATELGVQAVAPVKASRSVLRLEGRVETRLERWRKIAREAAKQSRRPDVPVIFPPSPFSVFLESRDEPRRLILCEDGGRPLRDILVDEAGDSASSERPGVVLLVGPEGGWSKGEQQQAVEKGFEAVSLGTNILRAETAALAALAAIQIFWGE